MVLESGSWRTLGRLQLDSTIIPPYVLIEGMQSLMNNHIHHDKLVALEIKGISTGILQEGMADALFI